MNTLAAAISRQTATTERHGGGRSPRLRRAEREREGQHEERHRGLLERALGEEGGGQVGQPDERRDRDPPAGRERRRAPPSAVSPVSTGIASRSPLNALTRRAPVDLRGDHGDRLGPDRVAEAHRARLGAEAVLQPVGPVELRRVVVGVDALPEHADVARRPGTGCWPRRPRSPDRSASPAAPAAAASVAGAASPITRHGRHRTAAARARSPRWSRGPGRRTRNGATTTSAANPVAADSQGGAGRRARRRIARPKTSEASADRGAVQA